MKAGLYNDNATPHKERGFLIFALILLAGCIETPYQKLVKYDCWWGCLNESNQTGFCCRKEVPVADRYIFNCEYAGNRVVGNGN